MGENLFDERPLARKDSRETIFYNFEKEKKIEWIAKIAYTFILAKLHYAF